MPQQPEALGLLALMLHAQARRRARRNDEGDYVPFAVQDQSLWDWPMIADAEALLRRASALGAVGRFQIEAALQSAQVSVWSGVLPSGRAAICIATLIKR